jgi:hypothetical protein
MPSPHMAWLALVRKSPGVHRETMKGMSTNGIIVVTLLVGILIGYYAAKSMPTSEPFVSSTPSNPSCGECGGSYPCGEHPSSRGQCPLCPPYPDMTKYVLKSSIPPCPAQPDMSNYMLKTECPPVPDLSQYVLKSSIPKQQPIIVDSSACKKACGDCPPCPRPRCPDVKCPPPTVCPKCPPCPRQSCPQQTVKCKAEQTDNSTVRPFLAPLAMSPFGGM